MTATLGPSNAVDVDGVASRDAVAMLAEGAIVGQFERAKKGVAVVIFGKESPEFCVCNIEVSFQFLFGKSMLLLLLLFSLFSFLGSFKENPNGGDSSKLANGIRDDNGVWI